MLNAHWERIRKFLITTALALLMALLMALSGCEKAFDHAAYVKALLDAQYKAEFDDYIEFTGSTLEEAEKAYNENLSTVAGNLSKNLGTDISKQGRERLVTVIERVFNSVSYEVLSAEKSGDWDYTVSIRAVPITNFIGLENEINGFAAGFAAKIYSDEFAELSVLEIYARYADELIAIIEKGTETIDYGTETTIQVLVTLNTEMEKWFIPEDGIEDIFTHLVLMEQ